VFEPERGTVTGDEKHHMNRNFTVFLFFKYHEYQIKYDMDGTRGIRDGDGTQFLLVGTPERKR
jgi:hypothetical protein